MGSIRGSTRLLALIGHPVAQARSPECMNAHLAQRGEDAVLLALDVPPGDLEAAVSGLRVVESFAGAIVTMPHKQAIVPMVQRLEPAAAALSAANVIRRELDGSLSGGMLDGEGFLAGLRAIGCRAADRRVLILGAGGAASAIALALGRAGAASIAVLNRTPAHARELVTRLGRLGIEIEIAQHARGDYDLLVNATGLGIHQRDPLPVDPDVLVPGLVVSDIVVGTRTAKLVKAAQERGCVVQNGDAMLAGQMPLIANFILGESPKPG